MALLGVGLAVIAVPWAFGNHARLEVLLVVEAVLLAGLAYVLGARCGHGSGLIRSASPPDCVGCLKRGQEATNQHLRFLEALINTIPNPVFYMDKEGRYRLCNDALADRILDLPLEEIVGRTVYDFPHAIPRVLADQYARRDRELMQQGGSQIYEAPARCKGGVEREFLVSKAAFKGQNGECEGIIGVLSDITERRRAEQELALSQRELEKAMDLARLANWQHDPVSGMFTFNDRFYALHGTTAKREGGYQMSTETYISEFLFPEDAQVVAKGMAKAVESTASHFVTQLEHAVRRRDGQTQWVLVRMEISKDSMGRLVSVHGTTQDITQEREAQEQLKRTQEALRQREVLLRTMTGAAPISFYVADNRTDEILYFNERFLEIWKLEGQMERLQSGAVKHSELIPHFMAQSAEPEVFAARCEPLQCPENRTILEAEVPLRDGRVLRHYSIPVRDKEDRYFGRLCLLEDITARKQATQQIAASLKEKEVLLREVYHRVKNNLQVISSLLNLQSGAIQDGETLRLIRETQDRVRSMALVHEKLYRAKDLSRIDFAEYAHQLVTMLARSYRTPGKSVNVVFEMENVRLNLDTSVPCGLILNELVSNALKYAFPPEHQGAPPEVVVALCAAPEGGYLLSVSDNGKGLSEHLDVHNTTTLGLQVVGMLAEQLGGSVRVERQNGARFVVMFREVGERVPGGGNGSPAADAPGAASVNRLRSASD